MSSNNIVLISAFTIAGGSLSALNSGEGYGNVITLKKFPYAGHAFPYVSGQAVRFALRNSIREQVGAGNACIYDEDGHGCGKPQTCVLCDLMGFMKAEAKPKTEKKITDEIKALENKGKEAADKAKKNLDDEMKAARDAGKGAITEQKIKARYEELVAKAQDKLQEQINLLKAELPDARKREELSKRIKANREQLKAAIAKPGTLAEEQLETLKKEITEDLRKLDMMNPRDKRQSPLQVSPLMGLIPLEESLVTDFLTAEKPGTMDKAIVSIEASKNIYASAWALDVQRVGMYDRLDPILQTMNWEPIYQDVNKPDVVDVQTKDSRIRALLTAFRNISGFAKQARMMDSMEADLVVLCLSPIYSHLLIKLAHGTTSENGVAKINEKLWQQVINDLKLQGATFYVGFRAGFLSEANEKSLGKAFNGDEIVGSPYQAYDKVMERFAIEKKEDK